jgi:Resolvase, N terminal domain
MGAVGVQAIRNEEIAARQAELDRRSTSCSHHLDHVPQPRDTDRTRQSWAPVREFFFNPSGADWPWAVTMRSPDRMSLMFQITGAFAEFERSMIRQRVRAGLKRAVEKCSILGRPRISAELEKHIQAQLRAGKVILATAKELGVDTGTVHRIARAMRPFESAAA